MKIHEYQAKELLKEFGVSVPRGISATSIDQAVNAARKLSSSKWVVKAQIHAGGRGKGGGVKIAHSLHDVRKLAEEILDMNLVTHQTGPQGQKVRRLLIEEGADIEKEYYFSVLADRDTQRMVAMASGEGGVEIEAVAVRHPEKIVKVFFDPVDGLSYDAGSELARRIGIPAASTDKAAREFQKISQIYWNTDASIVEINPLILTKDGSIISLDAKIDFDANALFRHPEILAYRDLDEEDPIEIQARKYDLSYIQLDGSIGCLVNGAGLAMATMDTIKLFGGEPANFLDVGGGATAEKVTEAFRIMMKKQGVRAVLVNIFGGIMRCDIIAEGIINACKSTDFKIPLVVRMKGTHEQRGKKMLVDSALPIISADTMAEAASKVVSLSLTE